MRIYALMDGEYREEVPTRLFFRRDSAQLELDEATRVGGEPYLLAFDWRGTPVECDIVPSEDAMAERQRLRDVARGAARKRLDAYVASGGVLYSTSPVTTPAQSISLTVNRLVEPNEPLGAPFEITLDWTAPRS